LQTFRKSGIVPSDKKAGEQKNRRRRRLLPEAWIFRLLPTLTIFGSGRRAIDSESELAMNVRMWPVCVLGGFLAMAGCRSADHDCGCDGSIHVAPVTVMPGQTLKPVAATPTSLPKPTPDLPEEKGEDFAQVIQVGAKEEPVKRRGFSDITADPCFAHAPDYSWLAGELQYVADQHAWKVRYASVDEDDRYGGSMILVDCGPMTDYLDGQMIRVEGHPLEADSQDAPPSYKVMRMQHLNR
jgi:hypothetical protein